jgi:hypothetical protein
MPRLNPPGANLTPPVRLAAAIALELGRLERNLRLAADDEAPVGVCVLAELPPYAASRAANPRKILVERLGTDDAQEVPVRPMGERGAQAKRDTVRVGQRHSAIWRRGGSGRST